MARIKIELPDQFSFSTRIPIRITDLNYGGHVGNDSILSIIHEARVQYLLHYGFREVNPGGRGLIMSEVAISFKSEVFYGDSVQASVKAGEFAGVAFDIFYKLEAEKKDGHQLLAIAKTKMVCYDYATKKMITIPEELRSRLH
jgi:acyl-CoA thioester hydrolase